MSTPTDAFSKQEVLPCKQGVTQWKVKEKNLKQIWKRALKGEIRERGEGKSFGWALASGPVRGKLSQIVALLKDPYTIKDREQATVTVEENGTIQNRKIHTSPLGIMDVDWQETWHFEDSGADKLIWYQKTAGTKHIEHLCGRIFLKQQDTNTVWIVLFEELEASHRGSNDILKGHEGTFKTLIKLSSAQSSNP